MNTDIRARLGEKKRMRRSLRTTACVVVVVMLAAACGSSDEPASAATAQDTEPAVDETPATTTTAAEIEEPAGDWPSAVAQFLAYDLERQEIMSMSGALTCCVDGRPDVAHWEFRCAWIDDQAQLALDARPTPPSDAGDAWAPYVQLVEDYWTKFQGTCEGFRDDPTVLDSDPAFGADVFETGDARLAACETVLVELEPLPADAPTAFCQYPLNNPIPVETFGDLPDELEQFFGGGEPGGGGPDEGPGEIVDAAAGPTFEMGLLEPGTHVFGWFEPSFTLTIDSPWLVESYPDWILLLDRPEEPPTATIEIMGPGGIADPAQIVAGEDWTTGPIPTIPVPMDLTEWVAEMPLVAEPTATTVGGVDATYWKLEYDRSAPGNDVIMYAWQEIDGALAVGLDQILHLWHVPRPDGALLIVEQGFLGEGAEPMAPQLFEYLSFE